MRTSTYVLDAIGLVLSLYAVYVEHKVEHLNHLKDQREEQGDRRGNDQQQELQTIFEEKEETFTALCDIEAIGASCSTVFTLPVGRLLSYFNLVPHGHVLDVPNAVLGAAYYSYILLLSPFLPGVVTRAAVCGAFASSVFLAYQLTFVIVELCVLCWSTHFINAILMYQLVWSSPSPASSATSSKTKPA